jgi:hypothetical protein
MYAILAEAEYYGPRAETSVEAFCANKRAADTYIAAAEAASTSAYGCQILAHGQASGTSWRAVRVRPESCGIGWGGHRTYRGEYLPDGYDAAGIARSTP